MTQLHELRRSLGSVLAALLVVLLTVGCSPDTTVDTVPSTSSAPTSSSSAPSPSGPALSATPTATQTSTASRPPTPSAPVPSSTAPASSPSSQATPAPPEPSGSGFETALAVALPDKFGGWSKLESRQDQEWTIAVYSQLSTGQISEASASRAPKGTFEQVVADLIGPNADRVSTGAVCTSRSGIAGCAQQQDGLTVALTSPNMGEAQVAEELAKLLAALR